MAPANNNRRKINDNKQTTIRSTQTNPQHSGAATDSLTNLTKQDHTQTSHSYRNHSYFETEQQELQALTIPTYPPKTEAGQPL